uniref:Uncharacterized protein n=1 Tax=Rhizochromulina marina TaxID=1034831 RepID=A0A7S2RK47_9STRA
MARRALGAGCCACLAVGAGGSSPHDYVSGTPSSRGLARPGHGPPSLSGRPPSPPTGARTPFDADAMHWEAAGHGEGDAWRGTPTTGQRYAGAPSAPYGAPPPPRHGPLPDLVDARRRTVAGKAAVALSSSVAGSMVAAVVSAYIVHHLWSSVAVGVLLGFALSFIPGKLGDLTRALGVTLLLTLERRKALSGRFPFMRQLKCTLVRRRSRFPLNAPANLWRHSADGFSMTAVVLAAGLLGCAIGLTIADAARLSRFLIPHWLVALAAGGVMSSVTTAESVEGDLARCASMKAVGVARLVFDAAGDTRVASKTLSVAGLAGRKLAAFDQQYEVTRKVGRGVSWFVSRMSSSRAEAPSRRERRGPEREWDTARPGSRYPINSGLDRQPPSRDFVPTRRETPAPHDMHMPTSYGPPPSEEAERGYSSSPPSEW